MSTHADIQKQLAAYCGGDLDPAERTRVEEHLTQCAPCRAELADLQTALRLLRTTPEAEPPPWLTTRIMARVREEQQQKRSWLHRFFFPLHIKLPLEVAALLMVSVTGYYLARTVETELHQPASREELPAPLRDTGTPFQAPRQESPAPVPAPPAVPRPAAPLPQPPAAIPARPAAPGVPELVAPQPEPAPPAKTAPRPSFAPPPPTMQEERPAPAAEAPFGTPRPAQPVPRGQAARKSQKALAPMNVDGGSSGYDRAKAESAPGATGTAAGAAAPAARIRLVMADPASAPEALGEAVTRAGGSVTDDRSGRPNTLKARIPAHRMNDLLALLARLGSVVERPPAKGAPGMVDIEIIW